MQEDTPVVPEIFTRPPIESRDETWKMRLGYVLAGCTVLVLAIVSVRAVADFGKQRAESTKVAKVERELASMRERVKLLEQQRPIVTVPISGQLTTPLAATKAWSLYHDVEGYAFQRERYEEVLDKLMEAAALNPRDPEAWNLLARVQAQHGFNTESIVSYRRVLSISPDHLGAHQGLATLYLNAKRCGEAAPHVNALRTRTDEASRQRVRRFDVECGPKPEPAMRRVP